ncbi:MAG: hypothetical protein AB8F74_17645 [Saprospiraceae bacterium]
MDNYQSTSRDLMEERPNNNITFTPAFIDQYGNIEDVLGKFLDTQLTEIGHAFYTQYSGVPKMALRKLLSRFVTLEGTKSPLHLSDINIPEMNVEQLNFCLSKFETARILRQEEGIYELAHDTLALHIAEQRSTEEIAFLEVVKMVKDRYRVYPKTKSLLNANELQLVKFNPQLQSEQILSKEEWGFVQNSIKFQSRQRRLKTLGVFLIIGVLTAFSAFSFYQRTIAQEKEKEAVEAKKVAEENLQKLKEEQTQKTLAKYNENISEGKNLMAQNKNAEAISFFERAMEFTEDDSEAVRLKEEATSKAGLSGQFENRIREGEQLESKGKDFFVNALQKYQQALQLNYNNTLAESKVIAINGKLEAAFQSYLKNGDTYFEAEAYDYALEQYNKALRIKPSDKKVAEKIKICRSKN